MPARLPRLARWLRWSATAPALLVALSGAAAAKEPAPEAQAKRGQDIAAGRCARCHAIGRDDPSPQRITIPFRDLSARYPVDMLVEAAKTGSISGHDEMPGFDLGHDDVRALLTYIDSFAPPDRRYVAPAKAP